MADNQEYDDVLELDKYLGPVRAALEPDEKAYFKQSLGQESPGLMDYLLPQGRFAKAREEREFIRRTVLGEAFKHSQGATVGEAQGMFPNFPVPPSAHVNKPLGDIPVEGMDTFQGAKTMQVPDTRFQGPMPGVRTPLGESAQVGILNGDVRPGSPLMRDFAEGRPNMFEEGQRPMRTVTTGEYGPEVMPAVSREIDPNTKLPPAYQSLLGQYQHREGLKGSARTSGMTETEHKMILEQRLGQLRNGIPEAYPGETTVIGTQLGLYDKTTLPGSPQHRKAEGDALVAEAKGKNADKREAVETTEIGLRGDKEDAEAKSINALLPHKINELLSQIELNKVKASQVGQSASNAEERIALEAAKGELKAVLAMYNRQVLDDKSAAKAFVDIYNRLTKGGSTEMQEREPSFVEKYVPGMGGPAVQVVPRNPGGQIITPQAPAQPTLTPPPGAGPGEQAPAPTDDRSALMQMGKAMKDGETREYKGVKYKRSKGKLEKVN